jgi:hypothetical protein
MASTYTVTDLGSLGGKMIDLGLNISPDAINDSGVIVGQGPGGAIVDTGEHSRA